MFIFSLCRLLAPRFPACFTDLIPASVFGSLVISVFLLITACNAFLCLCSLPIDRLAWCSLCLSLAVYFGLSSSSSCSRDFVLPLKSFSLRDCLHSHLPLCFLPMSPHLRLQYGATQRQITSCFGFLTVYFLFLFVFSVPGKECEIKLTGGNCLDYSVIHRNKKWYALCLCLSTLSLFNELRARKQKQTWKQKHIITLRQGRHRGGEAFRQKKRRSEEVKGKWIDQLATEKVKGRKAQSWCHQLRSESITPQQSVYQHYPSQYSSLRQPSCSLYFDYHHAEAMKAHQVAHDHDDLEEGRGAERGEGGGRGRGEGLLVTNVSFFNPSKEHTVPIPETTLKATKGLIGESEWRDWERIGVTIAPIRDQAEQRPSDGKEKQRKQKATTDMLITTKARKQMKKWRKGKKKNNKTRR